MKQTGSAHRRRGRDHTHVQLRCVAAYVLRHRLGGARLQRLVALGCRLLLVLGFLHRCLQLRRGALVLLAERRLLLLEFLRAIQNEGKSLCRAPCKRFPPTRLKGNPFVRAPWTMTIGEGVSDWRGKGFIGSGSGRPKWLSHIEGGGFVDLGGGLLITPQG